MVITKALRSRRLPWVFEFNQCGIDATLSMSVVLQTNARIAE